MIFVPWSGLLDGVIAVGGPVAFAVGSFLIGLLAASTIALIVGADRRPRRLQHAIALQPVASDRAAAA